MYNKNLTKTLNIRINTKDFDFLEDLADKRSCSVSDCVRSLIGEYRRSIIVMERLKEKIDLATEIEGEIIKNGD